jgi:hypothetical protein
MRPYWQSPDGLIDIYHGDMRDLCATLRADAVITDAPFAIADAPLGARKGGRKGDTSPTEYHAPSEWDRELDPLWCSRACEAAPVVAWFGSWKRRADVEAAMPHPIRCEVIWAKDCHVGPPCPAAMRDERIWIFSRDTFAGQHFETTVWEEPIIPTWAHRRHKNEKPERLMSRLVRWVAPRTWTILDPFMGSGTTLAVCKALGMRCIGIDLSREHCDTAIGRLGAITTERAAEPVGPLFAARQP